MSDDASVRRIAKSVIGTTNRRTIYEKRQKHSLRGLPAYPRTYKLTASCRINATDSSPHRFTPMIF
ncbi:MAG: hypothetical protein AAGG44_07605, partial [Planctomycetota bacterium]